MGQHARPESKRKLKDAPTPKLKAGTLRVPRADGVFIGLHHRGITVTGPGALAVTALLDGKHSRLDIAIATGTPRERVDQIINLLALKGLIDRDYQECAFTPAIAERMEPELTSLAYRNDVDDGGLALFLQRRDLHVDVFGLDRIGSMVLSLLSASGIGAVRGHDPRKIAPVDVAGGTYRMSDVGRERVEIATMVARDSSPLEARRPTGAPDLSILCSYPTPEDLLQLSLIGRPYLVVSADPQSFTIGPLVIPSQTPCARCIALHYADADEQWGLIEMAQLAQQRRFVPSAAIAAMAASLATAQALLFLDSRTAPTLGGTITVDPDTCTSEVKKWSKHPLCGCSWDYHHS